MNSLLATFLILAATLLFLLYFYFNFKITSFGIGKLYGISFDAGKLNLKIGVLEVMPLKGKYFYFGITGLEVHVRQSESLQSSKKRKGGSLAISQSWIRRIKLIDKYVSFELVDARLVLYEDGQPTVLTMESLNIDVILPSQLNQNLLKENKIFQLDQEFSLILSLDLGNLGLKTEDDFGILSACRLLLILKDNGNFNFSFHSNRLSFHRDDGEEIFDKRLSNSKLAMVKAEPLVFDSQILVNLKSLLPKVVVGIDQVDIRTSKVQVSTANVDVFVTFDSTRPENVDFDLKLQTNNIELIWLKSAQELVNIPQCSLQLVGNLNIPKVKLVFPDIQLEVNMQFDSPVVKVYDHIVLDIANAPSPRKLRKQPDYSKLMQVLNHLQYCVSVHLHNFVGDFEFQPKGNGFKNGIQLKVEDCAMSVVSVASSPTHPSLSMQMAVDVHKFLLSSIQVGKTRSVSPILTIPTIRYANLLLLEKLWIESSLSVLSINVELHGLCNEILADFVSLKSRIQSNGTKEKVNDWKVAGKFIFEVDQFTFSSKSMEEYEFLVHVTSASGQGTLEDLAFTANVGSVVLATNSLKSNTYIDACRTQNVVVKKAGTRAVEVEMDTVVFDLSLSAFFIAMESFKRPLIFLRSLEKSHNETDKELSDTENRMELNATIKIPEIKLKVELPETVRTVTVFSNINISNQDSKCWSLHFDQVEMNYFKTLQDIKTILFVLHDSTMSITPGDRITLGLDTNHAQVFIPYDWHMHNIVENVLILVKACKHVVWNALNITPPQKFQSGRTKVEDTAKIPNFEIKTARFELTFEDDEFEAVLGRNYRVNEEENQSRLNRTKEFLRKIKSLFPKLSKSEYFEIEKMLFDHLKPNSDPQEETARAWEYLKEFNATAYVYAIRKASAIKYPPLMHMEVFGARLSIKPPTLEKSLEETLHEMDNTTPSSLIYDDLVPLHVIAGSNNCVVTLRDYSTPVLVLPENTNCEIQATIIAAESLGRQFRIINLPLCNDSVTLTFRKTVSPTKLYSNSTAFISTPGTIQACYGACYEPALADLINLIDNFTRPSEDPSPAIGGGKVVIKVLGSISPSFDPRKDSGIESVEISLDDGLEFSLTGDNGDSRVSLKCGEFQLTLPRQTMNQKDNQHSRVCLAKLSGGIDVSFLTEFLTKSPNGSMQVKPWVLHHQVELQSASSRENVFDSFHGFRSHSIRVNIDIKSPRDYYAGLKEAQNVLFLSNDTLEGVDSLLTVYQSLLTNVPIRRGNLFKIDVNRDSKPKLGRIINAVRLKATLRPFLLSFTLECEDSSEAVGVRVCAQEMKVDTFFRQYNLDQVSQEEKILNRKPVTKWIRVENFMNFSDIEGKVLSYSPKNSDLFPGIKDMKELKGWVFKEDVNFTDLSYLYLKPFLWSPKMDSLSVENSECSQRDMTDVVYDIQLKSLKLRLRRLKSKLQSATKELSALKDRAEVFFDESNAETFNALSAEIEGLKKRQAVIVAAIEVCDRVKNNPGSDDQFKASSDYYSKHFFHDVKILWTESIRNIIFRLIDLRSNNRALSFCLSNAAARVSASLVEQMNSRKREHSLVPVVSAERIKKKTTEKDVKALLEQLLADLANGTNLHIPCEMDSGSSMQDQDELSSLNVPAAGELLDRYMDPGVLIQLINPQVMFDLENKSKNKTAAVLTARKIQIENLYEIESITKVFDLLRENQDRIINFVDIWSFVKAQIFVEHNIDASVLDEKVGGMDWVPIECVIDQNSLNSRFSRIVEQSEIVYRRSDPNPLYIKRNLNVGRIEEYANYQFKVPQLKLVATSKEYVTLYNLIRNLLLYQDPNRGARSVRAKKMLLTLEQSSDLEYYRDMVPLLQKKIRQANHLLQYGKKKGLELQSNEYDLVRTLRATYKGDLFILIEGLRNLGIQETKKRSLAIAWQLHVKFDRFEWRMLQDNFEPLCSWEIQMLNFWWTQKEDLSSINVLEIDRTHLENLTKNPVFRNVIVPYNPHGREINFEKNKLIRIYWRENAPVAGIQVVEHFEINVHPLMIQVTFDFGVQLSSYIFANPNGSSAKSTASPTNPSEYKDTDVILSRQDESSQLKQMQDRADQNRSFVYIKVPGVHHCLSYRRSSEKKLEDLNQFEFFLPDLEYRNKTWAWIDFLQALKKDAFKIALANTKALVKEKLFQKKVIYTEDKSPLPYESPTVSIEDVSADDSKKENMLSKAFGIKGRASHTSQTSDSRASIVSLNSLRSDGRVSIGDELALKGKLILGRTYSSRK